MIGWRIRFAGNEWTDADLTAGDLLDVSFQVDGGWEAIDPWRSPRNLAAIIATLAGRTQGVDQAAVLALIRDMPADDFAAVLEARTVEPATNGAS